MREIVDYSPNLKIAMFIKFIIITQRFEKKLHKTKISTSLLTNLLLSIKFRISSSLFYLKNLLFKVIKNILRMKKYYEIGLSLKQKS